MAISRPVAALNDVLVVPPPTGGNDRAMIQSVIDTAFGTAGSPHGASYYLNRPIQFQHGNYHINTSPLVLTSVHGATIFGAGRFSTTIIQDTADVPVFRTNGLSYSRIGGILLQGSGDNSELFDLDWDNTGPVSLQSNTFSDMFFSGGGIGINIGKGYMGSENVFLNCFFGQQTTAGIKVSNYNALQQSVFGGNFQGCFWGIWVYRGSVPVVHGVGFQESDDYDIRVENSANDTMSISGCRTESPKFLLTQPAGLGVSVNACTQTSATAGIFIENTSGYVDVAGCNSVNGQIWPKAFARMSVRNSRFASTDWLKNRSNVQFYTTGAVELENVAYDITGTEVFVRRRRVVGSVTPTSSGPVVEYDYDVTAV